MNSSKISSRVFPFAFVLLLASAFVYAGDKPWKSKPFQEWDEKELQTILTDSPWVRTTTIQRSWLPVSEKEVPPDPQISGGVRTASPGGQSSQPGGAATTPIRAGESSSSELNVYVYWQSSRVMRAATARQAVMRGQNVDPEKYANEPQSEYQIILRMQDMTPFIQNKEEFFQKNAFLQTKKGKGKISPTHVQYERSPQGSVQDAIFFFPKSDPSGTPTISGDETDVQFSCKIGDSTIRVGFKPRDMVDQSGPAL
jgi:hypothetical protein